MISTLIDLFLTFFKIGAISFGGGYTIISVLGNYLEQKNWLSSLEYAKIVTISQMTPGPTATNAATYVGAKVLSENIFTSLLGAIVATIGVALPSFFTVIIAAKIFNKISHKDGYIFSMKSIRPAVIGIMLSAIIFFGKLALLNNAIPNAIDLNYYGIAIFLLCFYLNYKRKFGAISIIILSAIIGIIVF
jgi:chromate transporter